MVECQELGEQILFRVEAVGGEDGGVKRGVGVFERICAGQFEGPIERAQAALHFRQCLSAQAAQFARRRSHGVNLFHRRCLRPGEGVKNRFGRVAEIGFHF